MNKVALLFHGLFLLSGLLLGIIVASATAAKGYPRDTCILGLKENRITREKGECPWFIGSGVATIVLTSMIFALNFFFIQREKQRPMFLRKLLAILAVIFAAYMTVVGIAYFVALYATCSNTGNSDHCDWYFESWGSNLGTLKAAAICSFLAAGTYFVYSGYEFIKLRKDAKDVPK